MFILHNNNFWKKWNVPNATTEILVDPFPVSEWIVAISYFSNVLAHINNSRLKTFHRHWYKGLSDVWGRRIWKSFNCSDRVNIKLNRSQKLIVNDLFIKSRKELKSKQDVYEYSIMGYWIGVDIYETYLRSGQPTINFADEKFWDSVMEGIEYLIFWNDYLESKRVAAVILSHDCYNSMNILAKVAYKYNVPVYLPNPRGLDRSFKPFSLYADKFRSYRSEFKKLHHCVREKALKWSAKQLERRLGGEVGVDMHYSKASAFHSNQSEKPILRTSNKLKVVIYTHCFYDNPHGYGGLLFPDFYEWLKFLGNIAEETDYDWYVKLHPDSLPGTTECVNKILLKHPRLSLIPNKTSHHQLASEGISFAFTCYGSVGHELPLLGVQIVNAGLNPHIAYDFNWHPKTIEDYTSIIKNLKNLDKKSVHYDEICEFYYMNYYHTYLDSLIFDSHKKMLNETDKNEDSESAPYKYFIDGFSEKKHDEIIRNMSCFIKSGKSSFCVDDLEKL